MKNILITGANSFLGTNVIHSLLEKDVKIVAVVRSKADVSAIADNKRVMVVECDMDSYAHLAEKVRSQNSATVDACVHLAWDGSVGAKRADPEIQIENIKNTCALVEECHKMGCKKFLFAGSIGAIEFFKKKEFFKPYGIKDIYPIAKECACDMANAIADKYEMKFLHIRISNIFGAGEKNERLINSSIQKMLNNIHCSFSEGFQQYDFIYVSDAAKMIAALCLNNVCGKEYYIGSGKPRQLRDFLMEMRDIVSPETEIGLGELEYDGIPFSYDCLDMDAVTRDTGVQCEVTFGEGIELTKKWLENNGGNMR